MSSPFQNELSFYPLVRAQRHRQGVASMILKAAWGERGWRPGPRWLRRPAWFSSLLLAGGWLTLRMRWRHGAADRQGSRRSNVADPGRQVVQINVDNRRRRRIELGKKS